MKKTHISISLLVLILSLTIAGTANQSFTAQYNLETPKSSAGEITIITPENKTYIEPMSGFYPATYGFENDDNHPTGWITYEGGGTVNVINEVGNHKKVLELHSDAVTDSLNAYIDFNEQEYGTVEFWLRSDDVTKDTTFQLFNSGTGHGICTVMLSNDRIRYFDGSFQTTSYIPLNNTWYYFRIDFETTNGGYEGLSQWRWKFYYSGDDVWLDDLSFTNNEKPSRTYLNSYWADTNYDLYFDAIGYSWNPDYNIGDNLNEGLLLSYDNTTALDWQGFSLDGMTNKTILGNTTIPMPSDGTHSIQVFGNDTMGTMYQSDVSHFTVNTSPLEITINSPTPSQTIGNTAPSYDISVTGPYDSIWYSLDGEATNFTANSLTGTINQAAWTALADGIITIFFHLNNSAGMEGSAQVQVIKDSSEESSIPSYDLYLLIGALSAISALLIRKRLKS